MTNHNLNNNGGNGDGRVFYRGSELIGYEDSGLKLSSGEMLKLFKQCEREIAEGKYDEVAKREGREGWPEVWVNRILYGLEMHDVNRKRVERSRRRVERSRRRVILREYCDLLRRGLVEHAIDFEKRDGLPGELLDRGLDIVLGELNGVDDKLKVKLNRLREYRRQKPIKTAEER